MDTESDSALERLATRAFAQLEAAGGDPSQLPVPLAHFVLVYSAQGVLDNGGFRFFLESDWPGQPAYETFVDAYAAIGCTEQAARFQEVVDSFGFEQPHLDGDLRNAFIAEQCDRPESRAHVWRDDLCGDERVWSALTDFARRHRSLF